MLYPQDPLLCHCNKIKYEIAKKNRHFIKKLAYFNRSFKLSKKSLENLDENLQKIIFSYAYNVIAADDEQAKDLCLDIYDSKIDICCGDEFEQEFVNCCNATSPCRLILTTIGIIFLVVTIC